MEDLPTVTESKSSPRSRRNPGVSPIGASTKPDSGSTRDQLSIHLQFARIAYTERGKVISEPIGTIRHEPMFGLHNRDYPSLWSCMKLVGLTLDDAVMRDELREYLIDDAWEMGAVLTRLEKTADQKLSALFPTNQEKKQSSEEGFMNFAVGNVTTSKTGSVYLSGPLFLWKALAVERRSVGDRAKLFYGLTDGGYELLNAVAGVTPIAPHSTEQAERFFAYLKKHAPADWWGFRTIIESIGKGIDRTTLIMRFHEALTRDFPRQPPLEAWTETQAATNTAGYVARAREWGLVELKQHRGKYLLTDFGLEAATENA